MPQLTINLGAAWRGLRGGKTQERSQMVLVGTEDGRIVPTETDVRRACSIVEKAESAYLLDSANQFKNKADGRWYQFLGERSVIPICLLKNTPVEDLTALLNHILEEVFETAKDRMYRKARGSELWNRFAWLSSAIVIVALAVFMINTVWK